MSAAVARNRHSGNHRGRPWGHEGEHDNIHSRTITLAPAGPGRGIEADHAGNGYAVSDDDEAARRVCLRPSKENGGMGGSSHGHPESVPEDGSNQAGSTHSGSHRRVVHDGHAPQWKQPYRDSKDRSRRQSAPRDSRREEQQYRPYRGGESRSPPRMGHGYGASRDEGQAYNSRDRWDTEKRANNRPCTRSRRRDSRNSARGGGTEAHGRQRDGALGGNSSSRRERSRHREGSRSRREERQHERQSPADGGGEQQQPRKRGLDAEEASRARHEEAEPQAKRHRSDNAGHHHAQERRSHEERREERREDRQGYHRGQERKRTDRRYDERRHGHDEGWRRRAEEPSSRAGYESERHRERHRHGGEGRYSDRWGRRREEGWEAPCEEERSACTRRSSSERHRRGEDLTAHHSADEQQSQHVEDDGYQEVEDDGYQEVEEVPDIMAQPVEPLPAHMAACDQTIGAADDDGQDDVVDDPVGLFTNQPLDLPEAEGTASGYGRRSETGHTRNYGLFEASREPEEQSSTHQHQGASYEEENLLATSSDEEDDEEPPPPTTAARGLSTDGQLTDEDGRDHQNIRVHAVHRSAEAKALPEVARPAVGLTNRGSRSELPAKQVKPLVHLPPQEKPGMMPQESQEARKGSSPQQPAQPSISGSSSGSSACSSHSSHSSSGSSETCSDAGSFSEGGSTSSSSSSSSTGSAAPRRRHHRHHHGSYHHHEHGRGLSPPPGCFQARQQALQQGHPVQQAPPPGAPPAPGPGPVDYRPPPPGMPMHRPPMPGYGYPPPQMAPGMHFHRPPPFVPPGYPVPVYPMMHGMPPHPDVLGYGQLPPSDDFDDEPKGKGKGRGRRKRRKGSRTPRRRRGKIGEPPERVGDDGDWELSKEDNGLKLIGEIAPPGVNWEYKVEDESRRCFAGFLECPVPHYHLPIFFEKIRNGTNWSQPMGPLGVIPRKTAWMVKPGCTCTYRYGGVEVLPQVFPDWMHELLTLYMPYCGLRDPSEWPNSCNVNLYENGSQSVGWHADDEALFQGLHNDIRIISLSLGQRRKFDLRKNWPEEEEKPVFRMMLGNGCLCTMEGMMQKHYQHRVPKESEDLGPRINLTWRWILKHSKACPLSSSQ